MTRSVLICFLNECVDFVNFTSFGSWFQSIRSIEFDTSVAQRLKRAYVYSCFEKDCRNAKVHATIPKGKLGYDRTEAV